MREFLNAVFSKRFRFGVQLGTDATVSVRTGCLWCWHCGAQTRIVTFINIAFGPNDLAFTIPEIGEHADLLDGVVSQLPNDLEIGKIKPRFSKTQGLVYVSNGCFHCDAIIGKFFEHDAWYEQEIVTAFSIPISKQWLKAIESRHGYEETWSVHRLAGRTL